MLAENFTKAKGCAGASCVRLTRMDTGGKVLWTRNVGQGTADSGALAWYPNGDLILAGLIRGITSVGGKSFYAPPGKNDRSPFLARLSPTGKVLWAVMANFHVAGLVKMAVDAAGRIHLVSAHKRVLSSSPPWRGAWIGRFDGAGKLLSHTELLGDISPQSVAASPAGDTYITGGFNETATLGSTTLKGGPWEPFLVRVGPQGAVRWAQKPPTGPEAALAVGPRGHLHYAGYISGKATFGPTTLTSKYGTYRTVLWKMGPDGK